MIIKFIFTLSRLLVFMGFLFSLLRAQESRDSQRVITAHFKQIEIHAEVANTPEQRERGLMFRDKMSDNSGMVFIMPGEMVASFWMKNTRIPLSVAYMDHDGTILEIYDMQPQDLTTIRSKSSHVAYALEMNQHWFELNGIKPGDKMDISPLKWSQLTLP